MDIGNIGNVEHYFKRISYMLAQFYCFSPLTSIYQENIHSFLNISVINNNYICLRGTTPYFIE